MYAIDIVRMTENNFGGKFQIPAEFAIDAIPGSIRLLTINVRLTSVWNNEKRFCFDYREEVGSQCSDLWTVRPTI